jgi:2-polyprenyl-3-methyl-5-hydroxy-6-metoxy-1,4-benzoquinol methylase
MKNAFEHQIIDSKPYIADIEKALISTYFSNYDQDFLQTKEGRVDIDNNVFRRYDQALRYILPWISRCMDLEGKKVLEIGCGTGSSTAALAHYVKHIEGYDIHPLALEGARKRMEIMELHNVRLHLVDEASLIAQIEKSPANEFDIILLYAVLEHQTVEERLETLQYCWKELNEGGIMVIIDTPNILHYFDIHTSRLPFLHLLPDGIYARYASYSPREVFAKAFKQSQNVSEQQLYKDISRWGRGVSYHDFQLTIGDDYKNFLAADGFEPEIVSWFPSTPEEEMLRWYLSLKNFDVPLGFSRSVINVIFQKLHGDKRETVSRQRPVFSPPPFQHFIADFSVLTDRIRDLEQELRGKSKAIDQIYRSKTWKTGRVFADLYTRITNIFR